MTSCDSCCRTQHTGGTDRTAATFPHGHARALIQDLRERLRGRDVRLLDGMLQYDAIYEDHGQELAAARARAPAAAPSPRAAARLVPVLRRRGTLHLWLSLVRRVYSCG